MAAALAAAGRVFSAIACKVICGKLPKTNSLDPAVWEKWTEGLVPKDIIIDTPFVDMVIFHPNSSIPGNYTGATANLTTSSTIVPGLHLGHFFDTTDLFHSVFGDWIRVDVSAPEEVKELFQGLDEAFDDGKVDYQELTQLIANLTEA